MGADGGKARIPVALGISVLFLLVQDTLNTQAGVQGPVTIAVAALLLVTGLSTFGAKQTALSSVAAPIPLQLFVAWATIRLVETPTSTGLQNLLVWFIFPATIGVVFARSQPGTFDRIYPAWKLLALIAGLIYLVEAARGGLDVNGFPYSARGAGWLALFALVVIIPITVARKTSKLPVVFLVLVIGASLSRTPMAIAGVLVVLVYAIRPFRGRPPARSRIVARFIGAAIVLGGSAFLLVTRVPAIRDRFTNGDGYSVGGVEINSSGRDVLWALTIQQWKTAPWLGHGPGAAEIMITSHFPGTISHPHNEYLRLLDDTGIVGLTLWGLGMLLLLQRAVRDILRTKDMGNRALHIAALLSIVVLLLGSITDNLTISIYCVMIAGSVVGLSARARQDEFALPANAPLPAAYRRLRPVAG
jgi:O-antigen ligase